jgi:hypothetical protein
VSVRAELRRAAPALLVIHTLRALWALLLVGPLYGDLAGVLDRSVFRATESAGDAALAIEVVAHGGAQLLPGASIWLGSYALLGPWLQQLTLRTLGGVRLRVAAREALERYPAALAARFLAATTCALLAGGTLLALQQALAWMPAGAALELAAWWLCALALIAGALLLATAHDLMQAAIAQGDRISAALRNALVLCARPALARNALSLAAAGALALIAELASRVPLALPYALGPAVVLVTQQTLLFTALGVRAVWLLCAIRMQAARA